MTTTDPEIAYDEYFLSLFHCDVALYAYYAPISNCVGHAFFHAYDAYFYVMPTNGMPIMLTMTIAPTIDDRAPG